ncbi:hypothetical protein ACWJJH_11500 [Endozoicomonadaceae bacterium StTr2]
MATSTLQNPSRRGTRYLLTLLAAASLLLAGCAPFREGHLPAPCEGDACSYTATEEAWPLAVWPGKTKTEQLGPFVIDLPVTALSDHDAQQVTLYLSKNEAIRVKLVEAEDFDFRGLKNLFASSHYSVRDYADLLFTQKAAGSDPDTELADRYIWRMAMANKQDYFTQGGPLHQTHKQGTTLYWSPVKLGQMTFMGFITSQQTEDKILAVYGYNVPETVFKAILAGIIQKDDNRSL